MNPPTIPRARASDFFIPGIDQGFSVLPGQELRPKPVEPIHVSSLALASDVSQRLKLFEYTERIKNKTWPKGVVFPTVLGVADDVTFHGQHMAITGKYFISSAGGNRLINRYAGKGPSEGKRRPLDRLAEYFEEQSSKNTKPLPEVEGDFADLPFVMESRNFFNYYHFLKETFPLLSMAEKVGHRGRIVIITSSRAKARDFVRTLIDTWFPHLSERVELLRAPQTFERALVALDTRHFYYQCHDEMMPSLTDVGERPLERKVTFRHLSLSAFNSCESPVADLRKVVLQRLGEDTGTKRRLYVKRRSARDRRVVGGELLEELLAKMGFETVFFEDLTVEEQARAVAASECIVSLHGAGLANMLYAPKDCLVVELSNLQTLLTRFGDFNPLALAAGVHYLHVFLDHDYPDPGALPVISAHGHRGVVLSDFEARVIASRIHAGLSPDLYAETFQTCRSLRENGRMSELAERLDDAASILFHEADWHIWSADCCLDAGDEAAALGYLANAMVLAPARLPLLRRVMALAQDTGDTDRFREAVACFRKFSPEGCEQFLNENGWSVVA